jgi:PfaB family protein
MDLIISGMALSYQWWPSIKHFLESLPEKKNLSPALVEHFGEVIFQALDEAQPLAGSRLTIIRDSSQADLGHYLPLLESEYIQVDQVQPVSQNLIPQIQQAVELIQNDRKHHVVLCDLSQFGSAAVVLSHPDHPGQSYAGLEFPSDPDSEPSRADYAVLTDAEAWTESTAALLQELFQDRQDQHPVALGCSYAGSLVSAEIISLVQTALAVCHKLIPAWIQKNDPPQETRALDPLYINYEFRPWLSRGPDFLRSALLISPRQVNESNYVILKEIDQPAKDTSIRIRSGSDPYLFTLSGKDQTELLDNLANLEELILSPDSLKSIASIVYTKYLSEKKTYKCALLGVNREDLLKELAHAKTGIMAAFQTGKTWQSPTGSYFTAHPLGSGGIAFVYPGAFNSYPGMGRELFFSFPGLANAAREIIPNLSHSLAEDFLYLQSSRSGSSQLADQVMEDFFHHHNQLIESGITISFLYTLILDQFFNVRPDTALGYSLGEISMLFANRIWKNIQDSSDSWKESTLFTHELVGDMSAVRSYWQDQDLPQDFWTSFILKADRNQVRSACQSEAMAFVTIENAPNEVVIAGESEACQRVIQALDCHALPMPFNSAIHNPAIGSCLPAFVDLYSNQTYPRTDISFFSAAEYRELNLNESALAESMANMTCNPVDFPRLVEEVYKRGARLFIEVGPQKTCTRWIEKILKGKPHAVAPVNKKFQSDLHGILKAISTLFSHGVDLNLDALYPEDIVALTEISPEMNPIDPTWSPQPQLESRSSTIYPASPGLQITSGPLAAAYFEHLDRISADLSRSHRIYLNQQRTLTRNLARVMEIQAGRPPSDLVLDMDINALYSQEQIQAFTEGDHRDCFGSTFSGFGDRRIPRLPNGDLRFIDRVISIQGQPETVLENSSLVSEYDLPEQAWYRNGSSSALPHVSLLELALQPCGFLSAYMGTILGRESQDLYFRNLDGEGTLLTWPKNPGKTISNRVELLSSSSLENVIIQNYAFELSWGGEALYRGSSSFGYFPLAMLENQAGLDANRTCKTWFENNPRAGHWIQPEPAKSSGGSRDNTHLPEVKKLWTSREGGKYSKGYLYLSQDLPPDAWFYRAHFYQDPVMPGSLGVETMARAIIAGAVSWEIPQQTGWRIKTGIKTRWKYRGQITPDVKQFQVEIHLKNINRTSSGWEIIADGQLWKESKRIYQVEDLSLESY